MFVYQIVAYFQDISKSILLILFRFIIIQAAVSRLPDKGEKIHKQINALEVQLNNLRMSKGDKVNVIELS